MKSAKYVVLVAVLGLSIVGCKEEPQPPAANSSNEQGSTSALPANLRLAAAPETPQDVATARANMKDGERVVIQGVVGGRGDPIAANRAILTLLDTSIKTCDKTPDDGCTTPWDACCEPADVRAKNSVTVQVVDADGQPLRTSLAALEGVKPLARLAVTGTAKASADGALIVNADGIYVAN